MDNNAVPLIFDVFLKMSTAYGYRHRAINLINMPDFIRDYESYPMILKELCPRSMPFQAYEYLLAGEADIILENVTYGIPDKKHWLVKKFPNIMMSQSEIDDLTVGTEEMFRNTPDYPTLNEVIRKRMLRGKESLEPKP